MCATITENFWVLADCIVLSCHQALFCELKMHFKYFTLRFLRVFSSKSTFRSMRKNVVDETTLMWMTLTHVVSPGGGSSEEECGLLFSGQPSRVAHKYSAQEKCFSSVVGSDDFLKKVTLSCYSMRGKVSSLKVSRICCVILKSHHTSKMSHHAGLPLILFFSLL